MTIKEIRKLLESYPDDYIVVVSKHKGEGAIIAIAPETYQRQKARTTPIYYVMGDRRERDQDEVDNSRGRV
jgi:predicted lipase